MEMTPAGTSSYRPHRFAGHHTLAIPHYIWLVIGLIAFGLATPARGQPISISEMDRASSNGLWLHLEQSTEDGRESGEYLAMDCSYSVLGPSQAVETCRYRSLLVLDGEASFIAVEDVDHVAIHSQTRFCNNELSGSRMASLVRSGSAWSRSSDGIWIDRSSELRRLSEDEIEQVT